MLTETTTEETCSICLEPLDALATGNNAKCTLPCGHAFHSCCIIKVARSDTHCHGMCPLCRATPEGHTEPGDEEPLEDEPLLSSRTAAYLAGLPSSAWTSAFRMPADYETDDVLLGRAMALARNGQGSAPLRRLIHKLEQMRAEKHERIAALYEFRADPVAASILRNAMPLLEAKRRAEDRERQALSAAVGYMRRTAGDRLVDNEGVEDQ